MYNITYALNKNNNYSINTEIFFIISFESYDWCSFLVGAARYVGDEVSIFCPSYIPAEVSSSH